jgi:hypothetical protein
VCTHTTRRFEESGDLSNVVTGTREEKKFLYDVNGEEWAGKRNYKKCSKRGQEVEE